MQVPFMLAIAIVVGWLFAVNANQYTITFGYKDPFKTLVIDDAQHYVDPQVFGEGPYRHLKIQPIIPEASATQPIVKISLYQGRNVEKLPDIQPFKVIDNMDAAMAGVYTIYEANVGSIMIEIYPMPPQPLPQAQQLSPSDPQPLPQAQQPKSKSAVEYVTLMFASLLGRTKLERLRIVEWQAINGMLLY